MRKVTRLRRVALLCYHFVRNYAYYKAGWGNNISMAKNSFWLTIQGNFLDIAVLEWIKLFGNHKDKHHWKKIVKEDCLSKFKSDMLKDCKLTNDKFSQLRDIIKNYRDSFVAHLDSDENMNIPHLAEALKLTQYYYMYVLGILGKDERVGLPENIESYYINCFKESAHYFNNHIY